MTLADELRDLAVELAGMDWRTACPTAWTPEQKASHDRWMERMDRIDPEGKRQRLCVELAAMMAWPVRVVRKKVQDASGCHWVTDTGEALGRAEVEADPDYANDERLRAWFDLIDP